MEHSKFNSVDFYYRLSYDFMLFNIDFADDMVGLGELREEYGQQLDILTDTLVEEGEWKEKSSRSLYL